MVLQRVPYWLVVGHLAASLVATSLLARTLQSR